MAEPSPPRFTVRRVLVAVDGSASAEAAVHAAAGIASRFRAALDALFVEDIELVHLAGLPVGRFFQLSSGTSKTFDQRALEDYFRLERSRSRHTVEAVSARQGITATFRVQRGSVDAEVIAQAGGADLLVLGTVGARGQRSRVGRVALAAADQVPGALLFVRSWPHLGATLVGERVLAFAHDGPNLDKVLAFAAALAGSTGKLRVLLVAPGADGPRQLRALVEQLLETYGVDFEIDAYTSPLTAQAICAEQHAASADVVVLGAELPGFDRDARRALLEELEPPLLLVR